MLAVGVWLNVFVRQSAHLGMCNLAQSVNVISPLMTTETGIIKQTTYWPLLLFSKYMRGRTLAVNLRSPLWDGGATNPEWVRSTVQTPFLDVSGALDEEGWVNLAVVNISDTLDFPTKIGAVGGPVQVFIVGADSVGVRECNMKGANIAIAETSWDGQGLYTFQKHSFTLLRWKA
jgi:alpha-N-arabinofuranosidase